MVSDLPALKGPSHSPKTQVMELVKALLHRLSHRGPHAAALVAQQAHRPTAANCRLHGERRVLSLLASDPSALLCDGAFHQQHNEHKRDHDNGQHPEYIEVS
jgi:hypothetical protein